MAELTKDILISKVLNGMMDDLDNKQLDKLKNQLYICLHDVEITKSTYELTESMKDNDVMKLNYFVNSLRVAKLSEGTIDQYTRTVRIMRNFVGKEFEKITGADVKYYLAYYQREKDWSDNTIKNNIHYLNAFFRFLEKEELIDKNPMLKVESVKSEQVIKEAFSSEDMEKLRIAARNSARESALIEFLYATGMRVDELTKLKWEDIDVRKMSLTVRGKGRKERKVLFSEKAAFYMDTYFEERMKKEGRSRQEMMERPLFADMRKNPETHDYEAIKNNGIRMILRKLGSEAGVKKCHPHRFRRTFATDAINHGMPLEKLRVLMGHKNYDTTLGYAEVNNSGVVQAYRTCCE